MSTVKVIWPWARRKPHWKISISEIIKMCLQMVAYLQTEILVLHYFPFWNERCMLNPKISKPKILSFKTNWKSVRLAVFAKFHVSSPRNVLISIKQVHLNKRQTRGKTPILYYTACIISYACVAQKCSTWLFHFPKDTLRSQNTLPVKKKPVKSTRNQMLGLKLGATTK